MKKLIRVTTIPLSMNLLLHGQLSFLNQYYSVLAVSGEDKNMRIVRKREKVRTSNVEMERGINIIRDLKSFWGLYLIFKIEKPLIVHSITPKAGLLSMAAAYFANVPIRMHTFTGLIFPTKTGVLKKLLISMDKALCYFATNVYPEGQGVKEDLLRYEITKKPLKVLANGNINGINTSYFSKYAVANSVKSELIQNLNIGSSDFVFVFVGRLVKDKGINELIYAFMKLLNSNDREMFYSKGSLKLLLVGPLEPDLDPLKDDVVKEIENNPNIISVGFQEDIRPFLAISDTLAFPSYREGFPNVVMQAGSMGIPSIVTNINGSNEIIKHDQNGIIIPVRDHIALFQAMKNMILQSEKREGMASRARLQIQVKYEREIVWNALKDEYELLEKVLQK
ncbi:glycosyltransferase family 4 protein [Christiangramia sp. ASW11-125]|uniref:glycosyltransferase family 4 protein n=1 Tax=Christiangramia sp. ASW11-125 TaxID=3400701 RepID=UPI003AAD3D32